MSIKAQLEALSEEREDALDKAKELLAKIEESEDGQTDEMTAEVDALTQFATETDAKTKELLAREKAIQARVDVINGFEDHSGAIAGARGVNLGPTPRVSDGRAKIPATVRRYGSLKNFSGEVGGVQAEERAYRFGQYALAKLSSDMPGKFNFRQALQFSHDQFGTPMLVHGEGGSDTTGSHVFVPDEFGTDLIKLRELYGIARSVSQVRTMSSDIRTDPRRTGGLTAYFVGENAAGTESDAAYDSVSLTAKKLMAITRMSKELSEDSVISFGDELAGEISYAFANKEDDCWANGDGTSTYGGIEGVLVQLETLTAGTAPGLIEGSGSTWATLALVDFENCIGGLPVFADVPGQVSWVCHKTFFYSVMVRLELAAGGVTSGEIRAGAVGPTFLGYPVRFSQVYPSTTAVSTIAVTLGNYAQGVSFGDRRMETIEFSDSASVGGQSLWERDQIAVKGTERFDINVHDFGTNSVAGPICGVRTTS